MFNATTKQRLEATHDSPSCSPTSPPHTSLSSYTSYISSFFPSLMTPFLTSSLCNIFFMTFTYGPPSSPNTLSEPRYDIFHSTLFPLLPLPHTHIPITPTSYPPFLSPSTNISLLFVLLHSLLHYTIYLHLYTFSTSSLHCVFSSTLKVNPRFFSASSSPIAF